MTYKFLLKAVLLIIIFSIMAPLTACAGNAGNTEYSKAAATQRGISYSFEHPAAYKYSPPDTSTTGDNSTVISVIYVAASEETNDFKQINISLWLPTTEYPNAKARLDYYKGLFEKMGGRLLFSQRSAIQVAGIDGETLNFSYRMGDSTEPSNTIAGWMAFFDYKGQIVHISVTGTGTLADEVKADFDHLIVSFKFLN